MLAFRLAASGAAVAALALVVAGCAGKAVDTGQVGSGGSNANAGGSNGNTGGASNSGGSSSASGGSARSGGGGDPNCAGVTCGKPPPCPMGSELIIPEGFCCPICGPVLDCSRVLCVDPACGPNEIPVVPEGECCPWCRPNEACILAQRTWESLFVDITTSWGARACETTLDCTLIYLAKTCQLECGVPVNVDRAEEIQTQLDLAAQACSVCAQSDSECPPVAFTVECDEGTCVRRP